MTSPINGITAVMLGMVTYRKSKLSAQKYKEKCRENKISNYEDLGSIANQQTQWELWGK